MFSKGRAELVSFARKWKPVVGPDRFFGVVDEANGRSARTGVKTA